MFWNRAIYTQTKITYWKLEECEVYESALNKIYEIWNDFSLEFGIQSGMELKKSDLYIRKSNECRKSADKRAMSWIWYHGFERHKFHISKKIKSNPFYIVFQLGRTWILMGIHFKFTKIVSNQKRIYVHSTLLKLKHDWCH